MSPISRRGAENVTFSSRSHLCSEDSLLFISREAVSQALPQIGRASLFGDLLMMRYCVRDPAELTAVIRRPTTANGSFDEAVRAYAGLVAAEADPASSAWRLHDSVSEATTTDYFFAISRGGSGRQRHWKFGGAYYARAGLHTRLYDGTSGALGECIAGYSDLGNDRWELRFNVDYRAVAFEKLLRGSPLPFWPFAAWLLRTVAVPQTDREAALAWAKATVIKQTGLDESQIAESHGDAVAQRAWFYLDGVPEGYELFSDRPLGDDERKRVCVEFDPFRPGTVTSPPRDELTTDVAQGLEAVLMDAGGGRRLVLSEEVVKAAVAHLVLGRHLLFVGPPGTGKSTLAANIARAARDELIAGVVSPAGYDVVTASPTWSAFDTLGGYVPTIGGNLVFRPGIVLRSFESESWLVVDELNRADADKAVGPFMGVLAGSVASQGFPFEVDVEGQLYPVRILSSAIRSQDAPGDFGVPDGWRLIGTMNTYDKNSLFRLSYAFMRRFAFIYVGVLDVDTTLDAATQRITLASDDVARLRSLLAICETSGRALGAATAIDVARYVELSRRMGDIAEPFLDAFTAYVLPQLDSLDPDAVERVFESLITLRVISEGSRPQLEGVFRQMLDYGR
jgi:MoxR-like ATPase